ncbi:LAMI_0E13146g1_1 [Lachancea mirantina]|uniref:non-specific serine/threonine protein kinase n=1 Tax=Lachancea mirantina TaxID=1230905 RepID=A0A1G4JQN3_9SACH|nr:LAMI_0E13146g1_1 [Lachancea mirantina]
MVSGGARTGNERNINSVFKRTEVIGRGKFGVVYKGYHAKTRQVYAIKVLNLDSADDEVEDVQKEVQFLASLKQIPNITHYYGSYLNDTKLWVIMEYCAGGSLRTLLRPGKIDEHYIGVIVREVLVALLYIHKDNVIHRDIKAANVLIMNDGRVKLCDFGVAAQLSQSKLRRQTMAGTPYWMAPEVIMEGVYYDTKVDIWSLGITAFEIATGNPPYCDVEALRAMQLITKSKPPRLEGRQYSSALKEFIALCLDEDPKERLPAEALLKTKFIRGYKNHSVSILKELISRYLLHRDKHTSRENNAPTMEEEEQPRSDFADGAVDEDHLEMKWDFDSLSSNEYIIDNEINIESIPEDTTTNENYNYAYPDDDTFLHSNKRLFQGTTTGKFGINTTNSTLHGANNNSTFQHSVTYQSKQTLGTTTKKSETKASKALQQLFEESDPFAEPRTDSDFFRLQNPGTTVHIPVVDEKELKSAPPIVERTGHGELNISVLHQTQSTPSLPLLQTSFKKPIKMGPGSATALPTPIEIEIPEELPSHSGPSATTQTKPRSSTVTIPNSKSASHLQRRLTVTGSSGTRQGDPNSSIAANTKPTTEEGLRVPHAKSGQRNVSPTNPLSQGAPSGSPNKGLGFALPGNSTANPPSVMKPATTDRNDVLLTPLNGQDQESASQATRINRDFHRQNPNLKLQMPSPTSVLPNKLLEGVSSLTANLEDANINQFGFNTSSTAVPVAMTPVVEGPFETSRRNHSVSTASGSTNASVDGLTAAIPTTTGQPTTASHFQTSVSTTAGGSSAAPHAVGVSYMEQPPKTLQMDMFYDFSDEIDKPGRVDRKSVVLRELDSLLKMVDEGLPVLENSLREVLKKIESSPE